MARTVLRSRSGDIVTAVQLADRTGIVAASAPPAPEELEPAGAPSVPEPADEPSTLVAMSEPQRPVTRRVRRNLVFACAAALFLVVGWIGGGVWGQHDADPTPALAVGAVADQEQGGTKSADPTTTVSPPPVTPAPQPAAPPADKKQVSSSDEPTTKATSKPSTSATDARDDTKSSAPSSAGQRPVESMTEQLQQLLDTWPWSSTTGYRAHVYRSYGR
jgi:hypothetical protein